MTFFQIRYFVSAADAGNVSKAAGELGVSRTAISRALRELEDEFGVPLFIRTSAGLELTEDGRICYEKCLEMLHCSDTLEMQMRSIRERMLPSDKRAVRLCITPAMAVTMFPRLFRELEAEYPDIKLDISEYSQMQARAALEDGTIDFHLASDARWGILPPSFRILELGETEFVFCMPKNHRLAGKASLTIEDIKDEPLASLNQYYFYTSYTDKLYMAKGYTPKIVFRSYQLAAIREMVAEGFSCATLMRGAIDDGHTIVARSFEPPIRWTSALIWNDAIPRDTVCESFLRFAEGFKSRLSSDTGR